MYPTGCESLRMAGLYPGHGHLVGPVLESFLRGDTTDLPLRGPAASIGILHGICSGIRLSKGMFVRCICRE